MVKFINKIFESAYMNRWNDKLRPMPFIELDKQAHKMIAAYFIGKFEENKDGFSWEEIIEGGIFELLQRIVLTDIKPPVFYKIKKNPEKYKKLNKYVLNELENVLKSVSQEFYDRFKNYFKNHNSNINKDVLKSAHLYSSMWEFKIIKKYNEDSYDIETIENDFEIQKEKFYHLKGFSEIFLHKKYKSFLDLTGELRYQVRWSNLYREPKTSVLGHSLFVAILAYLFSKNSSLNIPKDVCKNNYITGLFHDLPEVLTRDIISPVKKSVEGLGDLIKDIEDEQMGKIVFPLIPDNIKEELKLLTGDEFDSFYLDEKNSSKRVHTTVNEICKNLENYSYCRIGEIVKAADEMSAYIEASEAIKNGSPNPDFVIAKNVVKKKYETIKYCDINFKEIYKKLEK